MRDLFVSVGMAFSMFTCLPMPEMEWKEKNMKYMLCALPLVGLFIGSVLVVWQQMCDILGMGRWVYAAGLTLLPVVLSGGIHMDGFCDTVDALASHAPAEKKRAILKDSNAGAFAVIYTAAYFVAYFALCTEVNIRAISAFVLCMHQVLSRSLGALAGVVLPSSGQTGLLSAFKNASSQKAAFILLMCCSLSAGVMIGVSVISGIVCTLAAILCFVYVAVMSKKQFGGMSGDLAGYIITLSQLVMLGCFIFTEKAVLVWF